MPNRGLDPRLAPKQVRSHAIVQAIVEAGRRLLAEEGAASLTTNQIAERAGVSIGSLYRYFPNRAAVVAAIYDRETAREVANLDEEPWPVDDLPLAEALCALVDFQLERHRRLLQMERDFYRGHHAEFSLAERLGSEEIVSRIRAILASHADELRVRNLEHAAFLVARGLSAVVRLTLEELPEKLHEESFRQELVDLLVRYVVDEPSRR
jgi:AcrR family transcriptional regulator